MATTLAMRLAWFATELNHQRAVIRAQTSQIERQQTVLDVQFRRIADIQAELDLLKATVRLAAPAVAARLLGAPAAAYGLFSDVRFTPFSNRSGRTIGSAGAEPQSPGPHDQR